MIDYEFNKQINTVGELRKYIGKPLLFYYNNGKGKPQYAWIKQLTDLPFNHNNDGGVAKISTYGYNSMQYKRNGQINIEFKHNDINKISHSNAQDYIRTLTKEEFNLYKDKTRMRRWMPELAEEIRIKNNKLPF
jgi:hypothetical protein